MINLFWISGFLLPVREEIDFMSKALERWDDKEAKKLLAIILSRTVRSCRATTHADLGTLKETNCNKLLLQEAWQNM